MQSPRAVLIGFMAVVALAGLATSAHAGGSLKDAPTPSPVWSGIYGGIHVGYGMIGTGGYFDSDDASPLRAGSLSKLDLDTSVLGAHIGAQWQTGRIVVGVEGDISFGLSDDSFRYNFNVIPEGFSIGAGLEHVGSIRGRLGYALDNLLLFGTVGWARATYEVDSWVRVLGAGNSSHVSSGLVLGAGLEYAILDAWSLRVEYLHYDLGKSFALTAPPHFDAAPGDHIRFGDIDVVRAALSFNFSAHR